MQTKANIVERFSAPLLPKDEIANKPGDAWTVLNGKVYDISLYADYHPGGAEKLFLGAGKDCTKLFNQFHPWVNGHAFLE